MKASDLIARCLENEGVRYVFGVPGEEILDIVDSLARLERSRFIPTRHEQGAAFMADAYGRLTGRAGRLPGHARARAPPTWPPGWPTPTSTTRRWSPSPGRPAATASTRSRTSTSTSSSTCARSPSGTRALEMPVVIPEVIRKAFKLAESEKPGACHIEVPEDVAEEAAEGAPLSTERAAAPVAGPPGAQAGRAAHRGRVVPAHLRGQRGDPRRRLQRAARLRPRATASRWSTPSWPRAACRTTTPSACSPPGCRRATTSRAASRRRT